MVLPATVTRPIWRLGKNLRLTRFLAWLTWCPYCGVLPQIAHCLAMKYLLPGVRRARWIADGASRLARGAELYHEASDGLQNESHSAHPVSQMGPDRGLSVRRGGDRGPRCDAVLRHQRHGSTWPSGRLRRAAAPRERG